MPQLRRVRRAAHFVAAALAPIGLSSLTGCSSATREPTDIEIAGTWVHEEDGRLVTLTFSDNGDLAVVNLPDAVVADYLSYRSPGRINWRQTHDYGGCWHMPSDPDQDSRDFWFRAFLHAVGENADLDADGRMYIKDEDTLYMIWGAGGDTWHFRFDRAPGAPAATAGPTRDGIDCQDPYRDLG